MAKVTATKAEVNYTLTLSKSEADALYSLLSAHGNLGEDHPLFGVVNALDEEESGDLSASAYEYVVNTDCGDCCLFDAANVEDNDEDDD